MTPTAAILPRRWLGHPIPSLTTDRESAALGLGRTQAGSRWRMSGYGARVVCAVARASSARVPAGAWGSMRLVWSGLVRMTSPCPTSMSTSLAHFPMAARSGVTCPSSLSPRPTRSPNNSGRTSDTPATAQADRSRENCPTTPVGDAITGCAAWAVTSALPGASDVVTPTCYRLPWTGASGTRPTGASA